eukprot:IDg20522t1
MTSETGNRRRRAGHPPPGNRSNFPGAKPVVRVDESFSFDVDDNFVPTIDALGETDAAQLDEEGAVSWSLQFQKEIPEGKQRAKNLNRVSGRTFIKDDDTIHSYTEEEHEEEEEEGEENDDDEDEETVDELEQLDFEEPDEDEPLLSSKD